MSEEIKEYPFKKTFDVKFDENAVKTFNDLIKAKGIRHFKLESDLYGILDVVLYEEYQDLQQKVEQLEERCEYLERSNNRREDEIIELRDENVDLASKNKQLENIRKEAIKLLKKCGIVDEKGNFNAYLDTIELKDLLNILNKGSE